MTASVCIVATHNYKSFLYNLLRGIDKYFLVDHEVTCHLFLDDTNFEYKKSFERIKIETHLIPPYKFPEASLLRYSVMYWMPRSEYGDYMYYIDVDSQIIDYVGDEILAPVVATLHPGYYNGGGSWGDDKRSLSYTLPENRKKYFCGGFAGGSSDHYYAICRLLKEQIDVDEKNGVIAKWHDETFWNFYLSTSGGFLELSPEYMMPEPIQKRVAWGINHFEPKILALEKPKDFRV